MTAFQNFQQVLDYLYRHLPMYQRVGDAAYKADLNNTLALDRHFGHPHQDFRSVHIAGTNGKGSVAHMLASVFQESGMKTGLYTSPHLKSFTERIKIDGKEIPESFILSFFNKHISVFEQIQPSFFEMTVALAFEWFRYNKVDMAVIETGMGGRLDSTNIITPLVSVITNIDYDHTRFLGDTLTEIAREKAGIIKNGVPVVAGEVNKDTEPVFLRISSEKNAPLYIASKDYSVPYSFLDTEGYQVMNVYSDERLLYENLRIDLLGVYQRKNLITVLKTLDVLKESGVEISARHLFDGLKHAAERTGLRGRWEILRHTPLVVADTAHNHQGITMVVDQIRQTPRKRLFMILGFTDDKELGKMIHLFPRDAEYIFTRARIPRAMDPNLIRKKFSEFNMKGNIVTPPVKALEEALNGAEPEDMIFIGGSTFVVAEVI